VRAQQVVVLLALATACGRAERQAAEARADSLQRVLQHQQDSLKGAREKATADSLASVQAASAKATAGKRREDSLKAAREKAVADSVSAERARPRDLTLFNSTGLTVGSQSSVHYGFVLDSAADCLVHGRIEVQHDPNPSSKSDVQVLLLTQDDYTNWKNNPTRAQITPLFKAGPQTVTTLNTGVTQSGTYNLVISNLFSTFVKKTLQGQVTVTCHGLQPRQP